MYANSLKYFLMNFLNLKRKGNLKGEAYWSSSASGVCIYFTCDVWNWLQDYSQLLSNTQDY